MNQLLVGPSIGLELIADNAVEKIKYCKGQTKESMADDMPTALRTLFEREDMRNGIFCAETDEDVERVRKYVLKDRFNLKPSIIVDDLQVKY